jgi:hypothetical protein
MYLVNGTNYEIPHYVIFCRPILLLLPISYVCIFSVTMYFSSNLSVCSFYRV